MLQCYVAVNRKRYRVPALEEMGLPGRKRTLLIVEDNEANREMLASVLEDDYSIIEATDGREGIERMQEFADVISLILLDIYMPNVDGFDVLRHRQSDPRLANIPVIVATSSDSLEDEIKCLELGANDFVTKPYNTNVLMQRMRNTIHMRESASMVNQLRWDTTTGLYRRDFFFRRFDNILDAYRDHDYDLVCCDIRNFKLINERYGREMCDRLLRDLANELLLAIPDVETSGRIGGDSFGYLIRHQDNNWTDVLDSVVRSFDFAKFHVRFGIIVNVDHDLSASQLCDRAILAIAQLRDSVGASVSFYDDMLLQRISMENDLIADMESALENREFVMYYQPKHSVRTGNVVGAEALVRWLHPRLGFIRPEVFVPVFERHGRITMLDRFVCEEVCREIAHIAELGLPLVPISINMSPLDFDDREIVQHITGLANEYGVDHSLLHLELTETAYAEDPQTVVNALTALHEEGFKIELDDFGTGYSSLSLLSELPLDTMKVDGRMIRRASKSGDYRIIQSALQIAQLMGLETVVEGVETRKELKEVSGMGCDIIQGFYYSWPLRKDDFEKYLGAH